MSCITTLLSEKTAKMKNATKIEFAVQMTCDACVKAIQSSLDGTGDIEVIFGKGLVIINTELPWTVVQKKIESTGKRAVLQGFGGLAAVAVISGSGVNGVVRFTKTPPEGNSSTGGCLVDGVLDGLKPGNHGLHIHECGDLSQGCNSVGEHYNPLGVRHGPPDAGLNGRHLGDLGNVNADEDGRATFRFKDNLIEIGDIIGRSLIVTENEDDFGKSESKQSHIDGNSGQRLAVGIIARSAGIFQNYKKICACDGVTLWDERDRPLVGEGRRVKLEETF